MFARKSCSVASRMSVADIMKGCWLTMLLSDGLLSGTKCLDSDPSVLDEFCNQLMRVQWLQINKDLPIARFQGHDSDCAWMVVWASFARHMEADIPVPPAHAQGNGSETLSRCCHCLWTGRSADQEAAASGAP